MDGNKPLTGRQIVRTLVMLFGAAVVIVWFTSRGDGQHGQASQREQELQAQVAQMQAQLRAQPGGQPTVQQPQAAPQAPAQAPTIRGQVHGFGESFSLGEFSYVIDGATFERQVGTNQFARVRAEDGSTFIVVNYQETNNGQETAHVAGAPLELRDATGRRFTPSSRAEAALMMSGGGTDMIGELQPGVRRRSRTAFEVPSEVTNGEMQLVVKERGLMGTGQVVIPMHRQAAR